MSQKKKGLLEDYKDFKITVPLLAQVLFTEAVFIFAIVSLFEPNFLPIFYIIVGVTLLIMAFNNYTYYKKKYFNAICILLSVIYVVLALYFIISTIMGIVR